MVSDTMWPMSPSRPEIWGIVNVTPDSFSDGGLHATTDEAVAHATALIDAGADVLDIGGESTRPGAAAVAADDETHRVVPVVRVLREAGVDVPLSVDTQKASVAQAALEAGATIVNDVSAGTHDPALLEVAAAAGAGLVLMHMLGRPRTMQQNPVYDDVVAEVRQYLHARVAAATAAGVERARLWIDPGIGFGKTLEHNVAILKSLEAFVADGVPVLVGASRKSFLGHLTERDVSDRLAGSLACVARARTAGVAAVRVHDVRETRDLLRVLDAVTASP